MKITKCKVYCKRGHEFTALSFEYKGKIRQFAINGKRPVTNKCPLCQSSLSTEPPLAPAIVCKCGQPAHPLYNHQCENCWTSEKKTLPSGTYHRPEYLSGKFGQHGKRCRHRRGDSKENNTQGS